MRSINCKGSILVLGLLVMAILLMLGGIFLSLSEIYYKSVSVDKDILKAHGERKGRKYSF